MGVGVGNARRYPYYVIIGLDSLIFVVSNYIKISQNFGF